ncbi:MAG TPA: translation initiation factor IF-2 N-terminal domain-containing protein, partial [Solirubrobacteraceae bacterium]|nr:translation initiation factor IF-2 N-terminal domain-containing protein [Solirubrobacteraceae bacterium]
MAKKRVHELAKERDMSPRDMLAKLQAAGLPVKAVASAVDEQQALDALAGKKITPQKQQNGGGPKAPQRPDAVRPFGSGGETRGRVVRPSQEKRLEEERKRARQQRQEGGGQGGGPRGGQG